MDGWHAALKTLRFEKTDHVPTVGGWVQQYKLLAELSGLDFWSDPYAACLGGYRKLGCEIMFGVMQPASKDEWRYMDIRGNLDDTGREFKEPEDVADWIDQNIPEQASPENILDSDETRRSIREHLQNRIRDIAPWAFPIAAAAFCRFQLYQKFGNEPYLAACALFPDHLDRYFEYQTVEAIRYNEILLDVMRELDYPLFFMLGDDICGNRAPLVSPEFLEKYLFHRYERSLAEIVDTGGRVIWHSDGQIMPIVDKLISIGIAGFQGFQEEIGVEFENLALHRKTRKGLPLLILGSVSYPTLHGSENDVKAMVERCVDYSIQRGGGLAVCPSNTITPEVKDENTLAMYYHTREYSSRLMQH